MSRPPIGDRVHVTINPTMKRGIDELARRTGRTRSDVIRRLVVAAFSQPALIERFVKPRDNKEPR